MKITSHLYASAFIWIALSLFASHCLGDDFPWELYLPAILHGSQNSPPENAPPTAAFTYSCSGLTCNFTDTSTDSDGSIATWSWSFGDGYSSTLRNPSHNYVNAGTYTVQLSVTDNRGAPNSSTQSVTVQNTSQADLQLLLGNWGFTYTISSTFTDYYSLSTITNVNGVDVVTGTDEYGDLVIAALTDDLYPGGSAVIGKYALYDPGILFNQLFAFDFTGTNSVAGLLTWLDPVTGETACFTCPWRFVGSRSSLSANAMAQGTLATLVKLPSKEQIRREDDESLWKSGPQLPVDIEVMRKIDEIAREIRQVFP